MKYKILEYDAIHFDGVDCYRIQAVTDFCRIDGIKVHKDDLGGYVSSEENLSQKGDCWLDFNSIAAKNSKVSGNAILINSSRVFGNAVIKDSATIDHSTIKEDAVVKDWAAIEHSTVKGNAVVKGFSLVVKKSTIKGHSVISNVKVENSLIDIENSIELPPNSPIIFSGNSSVKSFDLNSFNIFNKNFYSFTLNGAILNKPDDCCVVPLNYLDGDDFLIKYNSLDGPMIYNSINKESLTIKKFKRVIINLFELYEIDKPVSSRLIKPFIDWVENYDPASSDVFKKLADNIIKKLSSDYPIVAKKKSSLPLSRIADYLELHFLSLPWLLGTSFAEAYKPCIIDLIENIIDGSSLDIRCKKISNFGDRAFLNTTLFRAILSFCFYPEKIPADVRPILDKNTAMLVV